MLFYGFHPSSTVIRAKKGFTFLARIKGLRTFRVRNPLSLLVLKPLLLYIYPKFLKLFLINKKRIPHTLRVCGIELKYWCYDHSSIIGAMTSLTYIITKMLYLSTKSIHIVILRNIMNYLLTIVS